MMSSFKWLLFITICSLDISASQDNGCSVGDFCTYKCHCDQPCAGNDGICTEGSKCLTGWFGLRCQYQDLVTADDAILTIDPLKNNSWLTDRDNMTCKSDPDLKSVTVAWQRAYPLTWVRINLADYTQLSSIILLYRLNTSYKIDTKCQNQTFSLLGNGTSDIRCKDNVQIQSLTISGNISSLCSMYISGGRNIAYKQSAAQSSTYGETINQQTFNFKADLAVDGNTDKTFSDLSCSHTSPWDRTPSFNLTLQSAYSVNRFVIFNREKTNQDEIGLRLNGFLLLTLDSSNNTVGSYKDSATSSILIYYFNVNSTSPIKNILVDGSQNRLFGGDYPMLTLCELEAYGECPPGKWSLPCTKQCNTSCPTSCHIDDGSCNSGCAGYSNPPDCTDVCKIGKWGINCGNNCSNRCVDSLCDTKTGMCDSGCVGYIDPPYCDKECTNVTWGTNCSQSCSKNCHSLTCEAINGFCFRGCKAGFQLPDCTKACSFGFWGINCSSKCHNNCINSECNDQNGSCTGGCIEGFGLPYCDQGCKKGTYGRNCSLNCSSNCLNGLCDAVNGTCYKCQTGLEGDTCDREIVVTSSTSTQDGVIIGPVIASVIVIIFVIAAIIFWRKKYKNKTESYLENNREPYFVSVNANDSETQSPRKTTLYNVSSEYINIQETENTLIPIESLISYLASKDEDFYIKQFEKIPIAENVTQEIGHSQDNKQKNRYKNICPYDHSRVHLEINTEKNETDYINASYIRGFNGKVNFIAAQGPQKASVIDFIRMLWEQKVDVVVMLTDLIEEAKVKCEKYWPDTDKKHVGHIKVKLGYTQVFADYTVRKLELSMKGEATHNITQFHYTSWPDNGVPSTQWSLVDVEQHVTAIVTNRPILVHCSAGVGRTGTFIALYNIIRQAEETGCVDFFKTVSKLREDRICMVQTVSQYEFLHKAALVAIACMRTTLNIHDFSDRLKILEEMNPLRASKMELEFNGLCAVGLLKNKKTINFDDSNIYENAAKETTTAPGNIDQKEQSTIFEFLPGYKHKDQYVTAKLPILQQEAIELWETITQNNIQLLVAFEVDPVKETSTIYIPNVKDPQLIAPPFEIKLSEVSQTSMWEEKKLSIQFRKSANLLPHNQNDVISVTHLKCFPTKIEPKKWLEIAKKIRVCSSHTGGKMLFMCSDGVYSSGFMAVLSILLDRVDNESYFSVPMVVGAIRSLHPKILTSLKQYQLLYHIIKRHIETSAEYTNIEFTNYHNVNTLNTSSAQKDNENEINRTDQSETPKNDEEINKTDDRKSDSFLYANII